MRRIALVVVLLAAACRTTAPASTPAFKDLPPCAPFAEPHRDWQRFPATLELDDFQGTLFAVGDVHGKLSELKESLVRAGVIAVEGEGFRWTAGEALLVQTGDLVNKGPDSLAAIEFAQALEEKAQAAGGRVVVLAGNHEIGFLAKGTTRFYGPIHAEAAARGLELCQGVLAPQSPFGRWLRQRPAAAFVNGIYFSHSGNSQGKTREQISAFYRSLVDHADWKSPAGCGDPKAHLSGFFNADVWWGDHGSRIEAYRSALRVRQVVFGNDPLAFLARGELVAAFGDESGRALVKIDVGTVYGHSRGAIYRCKSWLPGGGCSSPERLVNPSKSGGQAQFEPLPVLPGMPPFQPEPPIAQWGC